MKKVAFKLVGFMTVLLGLFYPLVVLCVAQVVFHFKANGSFLAEDKGSELVAQGFSKAIYFWPRPSAIDYNPLPSDASNLGPLSEELLSKVKERRAKGVPTELLFASASGIDPHISIEAALYQVPRIAKARGVDTNKIEQLIVSKSEGRVLGIFQARYVNVLLLNQSLDRNYPVR